MARITDNASHPEERDEIRALREQLAGISLAGVPDSMGASRYAVSSVDASNTPILTGAQIGGNTGTISPPTPKVQGADSVQVNQSGSVATVQLVNDSATPSDGTVYGMSPAGVRGYYAASSLLAPGTNVTLATAANGVTTVSSSGGGGGGSSNYLVPPFADVSALLHCNGTNGSTTFTDQVAGNTWTANNATISTAQYLYGGSSGLFTGSSNSGISMPTNSGFNLGTLNWTIEFSIYPNGAHQSSARLFSTSQNVSGYSGILITTSAGQTFSLYMSSNNGAWDILSGGAAFTLVIGVWNKVLVQKVGSSVQSYVNGFLVSSSTITTSAPYYNSADSVIIGGQTSGTSRSINAYLAEFRFTKGLALVMSYPPLTSEFPNS